MEPALYLARLGRHSCSVGGGDPAGDLTADLPVPRSHSLPRHQQRSICGACCSFHDCGVRCESPRKEGQTRCFNSLSNSLLVLLQIYKPYFNPQATEKQVFWASHIAMAGYAVFMAVIGIVFYEAGISLGWLYGAYG